MKQQTKKDLIIVKVGTNVLADTTKGTERLDQSSFARIGRELRQLSDEGHGIILVSSGAVTAGVLGEKKQREAIHSVVELQRYAVRGWDNVVQQWKMAIGEGYVSSALLTKREIHTETMRTKALDVINCCLVHGDIFVVNENDTISDDEIKFGDNDTLAAALAVECARAELFRSVTLVLLTNINGLRANKDDESTLIKKVGDIAEVEHLAGAAANGHSRGGMITKVRAAKTAAAAGIWTYIADGRADQAITKVLRKEIGTCFAVERASNAQFSDKIKGKDKTVGIEEGSKK